MSLPPLLPAIKINIDDLYLDPNNPRLGEVGPGYNDPEKLFDEERQEAIRAKMIGTNTPNDKDPHGVMELISTILKKGWIDNADPIWVWEHPEKPGKYVATEGNRRTCGLKTICGEKYTKALSQLRNAEEKGNREAIKQFTKELEEIDRVRAAAQSLEVKPISAADEEELKKALVTLLSIRHINGARQWDRDASDIWLYQKYVEAFVAKHGEDADLFWDDTIIVPLATDSSITKNVCKRKLMAISWYENFKIRYAAQMPVLSDGTTDEFQKTDYFLFTELCKNAPVRDGILKCSTDDVVASESAGEAIFKWVFEKPSHLPADENQNKFHAHRCVNELGAMKRWDENNATSFASGYNIESPDDAPYMHIVYPEFKNAKQNAGRANLLQNLVQQLRAIDIGQLEDEGDTIREYLVYVRDLSNRILGDIEQRHG